MENYNQQTEHNLEYEIAAKKVKRIKSFYTHLLVFVLVNIFIVVHNINDLKPGETYFQFKNFTTVFFWGIGLVAHGFSVFVPHILLGSKWEERKIRELMNNDSFNKYK